MSRYISLFVDFDQCHVRTNLKVRENSMFVDVFSGDSCAIRKKRDVTSSGYHFTSSRKNRLVLPQKLVRYLTPHKKTIL